MLEILLPFLISGVLIALNGLFVAAEFAIIGAPRTSLERRANHGHRIAAIVTRILHTPRDQDRYIATAQIGITLASLGLGMYGEHQFAHWIAGGLESLGGARWVFAHTLATILAVSILTYFHIVFGEMIPKSLALQKAEGTVLIVTVPMLWLKYLMYPLVVGLNSVGNFILRRMGVDRNEASSEQLYSSAELQLIVHESLEGGLLRRDTGQVVEELFSFGELTAGEVMIPRVRIKGLPLGASVSEMTTMVKQAPHARYPVYSNSLDEIVGMVHAKIVLGLVEQDRPLTEEALVPLRYLPETTHLDTVFTSIRETGSQMIVVMDEHGGTAGIVTMEDVFEELIGQIDEEHNAPQVLGWQTDGRFRADGADRLEEVGEAFELELTHEEVDTVSGLILMRLDRPPVVGDEVTYSGLVFEVATVEGHGVREAFISREESDHEE